MALFEMPFVKIRFEVWHVDWEEELSIVHWMQAVGTTDQQVNLYTQEEIIQHNFLTLGEVKGILKYCEMTSIPVKAQLKKQERVNAIAHNIKTSPEMGDKERV